MYILLYILSIMLFSSIVYGKISSFDPKESSFIVADFIEYGKNHNFIYGRDNVKIATNHYNLSANHLFYDIENDRLLAEGNVIIKDDKGHILFGETIYLKDKLRFGIIQDFIFKFSDNVVLASKLAKRIDADHTTLCYSSFSPCKISGDREPIWQISAKKTMIDLDKETITYNHVWFKVYGAPIFFLPYFSHPSPHAKAKSGILIPRIKDSSLRIPLYIRTKPNLDFTLTPRFTDKYSIFELEARYKLCNGSSVIHGSYGQTPYIVRQHNEIIKNARLHRYHLFAHGDFYNNNNKYGFNIKRTSDKAYLKNYFNINDSYLTSKIYWNKVHNYDYVSAEGLHFEDFRTDNNNAIVLPKIITKNIVNINEDGNFYIIIESNHLAYKIAHTNSEMLRSSLLLSMIKHHITSNGFLLSLAVHTREDLYSTSNMKQDYARHFNIARNITEAQTILRYPLINQITETTSLSLEPIISIVIGRKKTSIDNKVGLIDSPKYELSEENLFLINRYHGIDYHEFGNRISYGIESATLFNDHYINLFLGQSSHQNDARSTSSAIENVGRLSTNISEYLDLFYKFRRDRKFQSIRDEIGVYCQYSRFKLTTNFSYLNNLNKYYSDNNTFALHNKSMQIFYNAEYQLNESWSLSQGMRIDMSPREKNKILSKTIRVTYLKDCVRISGTIFSDYTSDNVRAIKKVNNIGLVIGLKILNM